MLTALDQPEAFSELRVGLHEADMQSGRMLLEEGVGPSPAPPFN